MCPYDKAEQKEKHSSTDLGKFEKYDAVAKTLSFTNGARCWNGPARSLTVNLVCGAKNEIVSVEEPGKCIYTMKFYTPAVCQPEDVASLEAELRNAGRDPEQEILEQILAARAAGSSQKHDEL